MLSATTRRCWDTLSIAASRLRADKRLECSVSLFTPKSTNEYSEEKRHTGSDVAQDKKVRDDHCAQRLDMNWMGDNVSEWDNGTYEVLTHLASYRYSAVNWRNWTSALHNIGWTHSAVLRQNHARVSWSCHLGSQEGCSLLSVLQYSE